MTERPGTDILNFLMGMFSGSKVDNRSEVVPPLPLSFDRANWGRPARSRAPLLRLPTEILCVVL
jgi:hypothetical protein